MLKVKVDGPLYKDVHYNKKGWADASKYLPVDCDLCQLKFEDGTIKNGWAIHNRWDGLRINNDKKVLAWKLFKGETRCH